MDASVRKIAALFKKMAANHNSFGKGWKNGALGKEAFERMKALPSVVEGAFDSPQEKAALLGRMLELMEETQTPRSCIEIRRYMQTLDPKNPKNNKALKRLEDFIDPDLSMEAYCKKYGRPLKFDPVERTEAWEAVIGEVEAECSRRLRREPHRMGYCFLYWSTKREVLARYGIEWRSPRAMNPWVLFD